ncbi:MAG: pyroglutamyl-peptidase I [Rubrivivax sp.]
MRRPSGAHGSVLLTGFEPFGGESVNPSWQVAQALDGRSVGGHPVVAACLPCVFGEALVALDAALERCGDPVLVVALGQAGGRSDLSIERVAINVDDARIADNAGAQPVDRPVVAGAPAAYFSSLPIKAMVAALRSAGLPASVSQSAGTFVCNHVFYGLMHRLAARPGVRGGFIHLPLLPEQAARSPGQPSLPLATLVQGVEAALACALATQADLRVAEGTVA